MTLKSLLIATLASMLLPAAAADHKPVVAVLGDSYSTFEGCVTPAENEVWYEYAHSDKTDVDQPQQTWWSILTSGDSPYTLGVNNSYSGATISYTGYDGADYSPRSFVTRLTELGDPDIILVFGATNDSWAGSPVGEYVDSLYTRQQLFSFRPALSRLLEGLHATYPEARVYFILNDILRDEINESVETICRRKDVPLIRLHDIDKRDGHPTRKGMREIARQVRERLDRDE